MDTVFFVVNKIIWLFLRPESVLVLLYMMALLSLRRGRTRAASRTLAGALLVTILIGIFPLGDFVLRPLENHYAANPEITRVEGIIVLGGAEDLGSRHADALPQFNHAGDRILAATLLARRFPEAVVLYSGGETSVMRSRDEAGASGVSMLRQLGIEQDRLIIEGHSRNTAENARLSRELAPANLSGTWVLVTSAFHMPRAMGSFCAAGWRHLVPYPTDYRAGRVSHGIGWNLAENLEELNIGMKEWLGLLAYRLVGRMDGFFQSTCK